MLLLISVFVLALQALAGMSLIPAGDFWMGRTFYVNVEQATILERDRRDDMPAHKVFVDAFYMDKHEVTNEEYARFVEATGKPKFWYWPGGNVAKGEERQPVHDVTWEEADAYCRWTGKRLPTEAEWERAARGGLDRQRFPWGNEQGGGGKQAHIGHPYGPTTVGSFLPNPYGLYDMAGNVWEWTNDWYDRDYYTVTPDRNPPGPPAGRYKVMRGGGWTDGGGQQIMNFFRNYADPEIRTPIIGFRCAKSAV